MDFTNKRVAFYTSGTSIKQIEKQITEMVPFALQNGIKKYLYFEDLIPDQFTHRQSLEKLLQSLDFIDYVVIHRKEHLFRQKETFGAYRALMKKNGVDLIILNELNKKQRQVNKNEAV